MILSNAYLTTPDCCAEREGGAAFLLRTVIDTGIERYGIPGNLLCILPRCLQLEVALHYYGLLKVRIDDCDCLPLLCQVVGEEDAHLA